MEMEMEKKIKQSGFSLVEVMVAAGLLGLVSLGVIQLFQNINKGQADVQSESDYSSLIQEATLLLSKEKACQASLSGFVFNGSTIKANPQSGVEIWSIDQTGARSSKKIFANKKYGKLLIDKITFSMPDYTSASNWPTGLNQTFTAELVISGSKTGLGFSKPFKNIKKTINVTFNTDSSGLSTVTDCSDSTTSIPQSSCATGGGSGGSLSRGTLACTNGSKYRICGCSADWGNCNCINGAFSSTTIGKSNCAISGGSGGLSRGSVACTNGKSLLTCQCSADWSPNCKCTEDTTAFDAETICAGGAWGQGDTLSRPTLVCSSGKKAIAMMFSADWANPKKTAINYSSFDQYVPSCSIVGGGGSDLTRPIIACSNSKSTVICHCSADWSPACNCTSANY